jgi:membrane fusion protein, heavy metal efflux system
MKRTYLHYALIVIVLLMASCNNKTETASETKSDAIAFTRQQFEAVGMKIGKPQTDTIYDEIRTNGFIRPAPDGVAQITALVEGQVSGVKYAAGNYVEKGTILFKVGGNKVISLQNDYIKASAQYDLAKQEQERVSLLVEDKISARKDLLTAQNTYKIAMAEKLSLQALLKAINLDPAKVEAGTIQGNYNVHAPIAGYLTSFGVSNGQFIEQQITAARIIDTRKLRLVLNVFEKDVQQLSVGQAVTFYDPDRKTKIHRASISSVGRSIDSETKTIPCIAEIEGIEQLPFMEGMYAESKIILSQREVQVLTEEAIISENSKTFVLVKISENDESIEFKKVAVETGQSHEGMTEIKTAGLSNVLIKGAYYYQTAE